MTPLDPDDLQGVTYVRWGAGPCWAVALIVDVCPTEASAADATDHWAERLGYVGPGWVRRERAAALLGVGAKMIDKLRRGGKLRGRRVAVTNRAYVHRDDLAELIAARKATRSGDET